MTDLCLSVAVEPLCDLVSVEADELAHLQVRDSLVGDQTAARGER
jgi:hypothetical protein